MPAQELPLALRIDLAEAFIELSWKRLPARRTGVIEEARWRHANADALDDIDWYLEGLLGMYRERDDEVILTGRHALEKDAG